MITASCKGLMQNRADTLTLLRDVFRPEFDLI